MLSRVFLIQQNKCCGLKCLMCPYEEKHSGESNIIRAEVWDDLSDWEMEELKHRIDNIKLHSNFLQKRS
tara:strand:- start:236 stop:442 length:207 start_codon:yes stop_codon:yes gene_type:complete